MPKNRYAPHRVARRQKIDAAFERLLPRKWYLDRSWTYARIAELFTQEGLAKRDGCTTWNRYDVACYVRIYGPGFWRQHVNRRHQVRQMTRREQNLYLEQS